METEITTSDELPAEQIPSFRNLAVAIRDPNPHINNVGQGILLLVMGGGMLGQ